MNIVYFSFTDIGPRNENQDAIQVGLIDNNFRCCIADGVGGSNCGQFASNFSVTNFMNQKFKNEYKDEYVSFLENTDNLLKNYSITHPECSGMATTFTGCIVDGKKIYGVHVGDCMLCVLRGNGIKQLTNSHTEVARLLQEGLLTFEQSQRYPRRNVLESALGSKLTLKTQIFEFELKKNDRIILSTDGFYDKISKKELRDWSIVSNSLEDFHLRIVEEVKNKKLSDNATYILFEI